MRLAPVLVFAALFASCGSSPSTAPVAGKASGKVKITQFYAPAGKVPKGLKGNLCYGVTNAARVELDPPSEQVWPALTRCFEISPTKNTTYTLTAFGEDGSTDRKTADVKMAAAPPRIYDLWINKSAVQRGEDVQVCFKVENTTSVKASPGRLDAGRNCVFHNPTKTTTYKIVALGGDREEDTATVTVKVR